MAALRPDQAKSGAAGAVIRSEGVDGPALTGTLTVRNVTMPVTLSIEQSADMTVEVRCVRN